MQNSFYRATYIINGDEKSEELYLSSPKAVRDEMGARGIIVNRIERVETPWWKQEVITLSYKKKFLRAIGFHVKAGMTPAKALKVVAEGEENHSVRQKLELAQQVIIRGGKFSDAMEMLEFYPQAVIALLAAGEKTGTLPESVEMANQYMTENQGNAKANITSAIWFGLEFAMAIAGVVSVQYQFLPWIRDQVADNSKDAAVLEGIMRKIDLAFLINGMMMWVAIVMVGVIVTTFGILLYGKGETKVMAAKFVSKIPGMKTVIYDGEFYVGFSLISKMLSKGVSFSEAVKTCQATAKMPDIKRLWGDVEGKIQSGFAIAHAMSYPKFFSKSEMVELQAHQDAKQLQQVMMTMADDRKEASMQGRKRVIMAGFGLAMGYSLMSALIAIWALMLQSEGINMGLQ